MIKVLIWIQDKVFNFTFIASLSVVSLIWTICLIIDNKRQDEEINYLMEQVLILTITDNDLYKNQNELIDRLLDGLESLKKQK